VGRPGGQRAAGRQAGKKARGGGGHRRASATVHTISASLNTSKRTRSGSKDAPAPVRDPARSGRKRKKMCWSTRRQFGPRESGLPKIGICRPCAAKKKKKNEHSKLAVTAQYRISRVPTSGNDFWFNHGVTESMPPKHCELVRFFLFLCVMLGRLRVQVQDIVSPKVDMQTRCSPTLMSASRNHYQAT